MALAAQDPRVRIVELSRNFGKEAALTAAIDHARGDAVIPIDVDLQDPPEVIPKLIQEWRRGAEVILARRIDRMSDSYLKRSTARLFYRLHNRLSAIKIPQDVGDFRLIDRVVIDALGRLEERQRFMKSLFAWLGFKTTVVDYTRQPRAASTTSFSSAALRVWTYIGGGLALLTLCYAIFVVLRMLIEGVVVPGYASLLVAVLFLGSLQLIGSGVLGEYIGRIYIESKKRPTHLMRQLHEPGRPDGRAQVLPPHDS